MKEEVITCCTHIEETSFPRNANHGELSRSQSGSSIERRAFHDDDDEEEVHEDWETGAFFVHSLRLKYLSVWKCKWSKSALNYAIFTT